MSVLRRRCVDAASKLDAVPILRRFCCVGESILRRCCGGAWCCVDFAPILRRCMNESLIRAKPMYLSMVPGSVMADIRKHLTNMFPIRER